MIKNIETKIRLSFITSIATLVACIIICIGDRFLSYKQINLERDKIYVLQENIPTTAVRMVTNNRTSEYKGLVDVFHTLFFTIPPDDKQITYQIGKAMYLIDNSGLTEYNNLKEQGFYTSIISSSSHINIQSDSIVVDPQNKNFIFYGKQIISKLNATIIRSVITAGNIKDVPRTDNNPFGALILNWHTISNKDLKTDKKTF